MTPPIVVTGTDTDVGKTVFAAGLAGWLDGAYWKPVQAGLEPETDSETARRLSGLPDDRVLPEAWRLRTPASPHLAAEIDGVSIDPAALSPATMERTLVVEGAGGLMVPLTRDVLFIDVFARWRAPVVLCARTSLGTINHTLLSIEALRRRDIPLLGVALIGDAHDENQRIIAERGETTVLGRLPWLSPLTPSTLKEAFADAFRRADFPTQGGPS
jgi:dethiobiotin synthetase